MKRLRVIGSALFFLALAPFSAVAGDLGLMRISLISGDVLISGQDTEEWTPAALNVPLNESDRLWVPEGARIETQIRGDVYVRAGEKTAFDILLLASDAAQIYLDQGHLFINNRRGGIKTVQADTPTASVRSYDNSILMLDAAEDGALEVSVLKGYAYAETRAGTTRVNAGNTLTLRADGTAEIAPLGPTDEWDRWNLDRDQQLTGWGESARYLPDELHDYSPEFDQNGQWVYTGEYGYVWSPAATAADWAPYTVGRWVWVRGSYVWISYEPWGWVPYHYGRWVYEAHSGWCWAPPAAGAVHWAPGYVGWVVTPAYVAWVPLAPGEVYYGYGSYGPGSVNISTVNIDAIAVQHGYKHAHRKNAVTAVQRDSFGTGRRVPAPMHDNPFLHRTKEKIEIAPPRVKPKRPVVFLHEGMRPEMRQPPPQRKEPLRPQRPARSTTPGAAGVDPEQRVTVPPAAKPPERVRTIRPEELKARRRLVKEREGSVFRSGPPQNLPVRKMTAPKEIIRKQQPSSAGRPQNTVRPEQRGGHAPGGMQR